MEGLASLPAPKNDYEIVIPDQEGGEGEAVASEQEGYIQDQADIDADREKELARQSKTH